MKKRFLVLAMVTCLWAAALALAEDNPQPASGQTAAATQNDKDCAQGKAQTQPAPEGWADAPQNQVEYGGGA
jgi:hypothetical protein